MTTAGTSIRETIPGLTSTANVELVGLIVSVDRMEKGKSQAGALAEIQAEFNMPTAAIVNLDETVTYLHSRPIAGKAVLDDHIYRQIQAYRAEYGAQA